MKQNSRMESKTALFFSMLMIGGAAFAASFPTPSVWIIDPTASTSSDNGPLPADKTIRIASFSTTRIAITERFTDQAGTVQEIGWSGVSGVAQPVKGMTGASGFFRYDGSYSFVLQDGTAEQGVFTLSEKKRVLTDTYTVTLRGRPPVHVKDVYKRAD